VIEIHNLEQKSSQSATAPRTKTRYKKGRKNQTGHTRHIAHSPPNGMESDPIDGFVTAGVPCREAFRWLLLCSVRCSKRAATGVFPNRFRTLLSIPPQTLATTNNCHVHVGPAGPWPPEVSVPVIQESSGELSTTPLLASCVVDWWREQIGGGDGSEGPE
jgi:hypothetical protein